MAICLASCGDCAKYALPWNAAQITNLQMPESPTFEIANFEDGCPRLCGRTLQLGTVDLYEAL
jgi:hypothetical protein